VRDEGCLSEVDGCWMAVLGEEWGEVGGFPEVECICRLW
jgi:hypothetical protein